MVLGEWFLFSLSEKIRKKVAEWVEFQGFSCSKRGYQLTILSFPEFLQIFITLRDERRELAVKIAQRKAVEEDRDNRL